MIRRKMTHEELIKKVGYDPILLSEIQPQGGINTKDDKYIKTGDGYVGCIHVYEYPNELDTHWMADVTNSPNIITTIDLSTDNIIEVKKNINKAINEQYARSKMANDYEELYDAQQRIDELKRMYDEIKRMGEVIKLVQIRIFISARTWFEIEEAAKGIMDKLNSDGYKGAIFLNEGEDELKSLYQSYTEQKENVLGIEGQPLLSDIIAGGYPFHFSEHYDPHGMILGYTPSGGLVIFDEFEKTGKRLYYNSLVIGEMGAGKSTLLKIIFSCRVIRGDYVRAFDISGEFTDLTEEYGGKVLQLDGSDGVLNMLEILKYGDNEKINYARHISKLHIIYKFWMPDANEYEVIAFEETVRELYIKWGLIDQDGEIRNRITGLPAKDYPILSDLCELIEEKISKMSKGNLNSVQKQIQIQEISKLSNIRDTLRNIINTYGELFNKHTTFDNIMDIQTVTFNISTIKELKDSIFDSLLYNVICLCWDNAVTNGTIMKKAYEDKTLQWEDIVRYLIIIDESHRFLNAKKTQAIEQMLVYLREGRKYFAGIMLASQSIRDYVPEDNSPGLDKMKELFELTQYKFIFRQTTGAIEILNKAFNKQLTLSELDRIPYLEVGETILCINSEKNIELKVELMEEDRILFNGGA